TGFLIIHGERRANRVVVRRGRRSRRGAARSCFLRALGSGPARDPAAARRRAIARVRARRPLRHLLAGGVPPHPGAGAGRAWAAAIWFLCAPGIRAGGASRTGPGEEPLLVPELAPPFDISLQAVSRHIQVLVRAGLVQQQRTGRISRCSLLAGPIFAVAVWINRYSKYWQEQFDMLAAMLGEVSEPLRPKRRAARRKTTGRKG